MLRMAEQKERVQDTDDITEPSLTLDCLPLGLFCMTENTSLC